MFVGKIYDTRGLIILISLYNSRKIFHKGDHNITWYYFIGKKQNHLSGKCDEIPCSSVDLRPDNNSRSIGNGHVFLNQAQYGP